jgi:hypothetical protein
MRHKISRFSAALLHNNTVISLVLFIIALLPRLLAPDRFLTADEFLWVDRSLQFLAGMLNPAHRCATVVATWEFAEGLACTLRTGHPGVTTMWTGSFGLWLSWLAQGGRLPLYDYLMSLSTNPLDAFLIAPARVGTILLTSAWVVAVYGLARRLFGRPLALLGALLIALDPFHIALSRVIHHDALSAGFMTLSVLTAFIYWGERARKPWLLASGALAGLAFLSKSPALFLMPFIAVTGLWFTGLDIRRRLQETNAPPLLPLAGRLLLGTLGDGLLWFALSLAVVFIVWPAMWVAPLEALETVFFIGSKYATGGHAKGNFFLGQISQDPGLLFYPVTWFYRASPVVVAGLLMALIAWPLRYARRPNKAASVPAGTGSETPDRRQPSPTSAGRGLLFYAPVILIFIAGYYLLMTLGEKKQDRYFLPVFPWLNLLAAGGLLSIINAFSGTPQLRHLPANARSLERPNYQLPITNYQLPITNYQLPINVLRFTALLLIVLGVNGSLIYHNFPYYFTYYNPLLGGIQGAAKALTIGWGEGLDLAAAYLNRQGPPGRTRVASWYESTFAPYYYGPSLSYSKEKGKALAGDYVIFYINQTQRRFPDDIFFEYFESRFSPAHVVSLHGLDYAWIYPSLGIDHYIQDQTYTGIASLLAWQWELGDRPLIPGRNSSFELYWEYLGKRPDEPFFFRLVDAQYRPWAEAASQPYGNPPFERWREGEIIHEAGRLKLPQDMPAGQYQLQIGIFTNAPAVESGELLFILPPEEALITVGHAVPTMFDIPRQATPVGRPIGPALTLLGALLPEEPVEPGGKIPLELYWHVTQPLPASAELHLGLMDQAGQARQGWFNLSLSETFNPDQTTWQPGAVGRTRWELDLLPDTPPGPYHFELVLPQDVSRVLPFGQLELRAPRP